MEQISNVKLSSFRNGEHFQFMTDVKNGITAATPAALNLEEVFARFNTSYLELDSVLRVDMGSVKTEQLVVADINRDDNWSALNLRVKAALLSPFEEEVAAATRIKRVFDLYGNVRQLSYVEETGLITNLVDDLTNRDNAADCETLQITPWVNALSDRNQLFQTLFNQRNAEYANKQSGDVKAARAVIDPVYGEIVKRLNALVTLDMASAEAQTFIEDLNQRIKYYEELIAARKGRTQTEEDDAPAPPETD